jgi:TetR/AcrR family transcriptional regulator, cholesterol catabolism regulator
MKTPAEDTKKQQKILAAAVGLFRRTHDVKRVSLETIAREAKVSPTTIYNNFGSREKLLYEVVKVLVRETLEHNRDLVYSDIPFPQKITSIISGKIDMASQVNGEIIRKMVGQDKTVAPFIDEIFRSEITPLWKVILADGKKQGYIDASLDDNALIIYLDVMKAGFAARRDIMQDFPMNLDLIKQLTHIMFYGFLKKDIGLFKNGGK